LPQRMAEEDNVRTGLVVLRANVRLPGRYANNSKRFVETRRPSSR
jgi:hypothetical protein